MSTWKVTTPSRVARVTTTNATSFKLFGHPDFGEGTIPLTAREKTIEKIIYTVSATLNFMGDSPSLLRSKLTALSDDTIGMVETTVDHLAERHQPDDKFIAKTVLHYEESLIREAMFYRSFINDEFNIHLGYIEQVGIINGLRELDYFKGRENLDALSGPDLDVAKAFINVTAALMGYTYCQNVTIDQDVASSPKVYIHNKELQDLVLDHHDRVEHMLILITTRETESTELIRECLENATPLQDGVL